MTGKIVAAGRSHLNELSEAFDDADYGNDLVMLIRFNTQEEFALAINGESTKLEWDFGGEAEGEG